MAPHSEEVPATMQRFDIRDILGGLLLIALGLFFALYGTAEYPIGELRRMGPGFFPVALGYVLVGLGVLLVLPALRPTTDRLDPFAWRVFVAVMAAIAAFALVLPRLGMVPATIVLTVVSAFAEFRVYPFRIAVLAVALSFVAVLIFTWGLGVPVPAFRWGF
jgi:hypothetical protein